MREFFVCVFGILSVDTLRPFFDGCGSGGLLCDVRLSDKIFKKGQSRVHIKKIIRIFRPIQMLHHRCLRMELQTDGKGFIRALNGFDHG